MFGILLQGAIEDVKTIVSAINARLNDTIANRINDTITSRAPASTAVSNLDLTTTVIGRIDKSVSSRLGLKSIQRVTITILSGSNSATANITSVNTAKAVVVHLGSYSSSGGASDAANSLAAVDLTNATTLTAQRGTTDGHCYVKVQVLEFD